MSMQKRNLELIVKLIFNQKGDRFDNFPQV